VLPHLTQVGTLVLQLLKLNPTELVALGCHQHTSPEWVPSMLWFFLHRALALVLSHHSTHLQVMMMTERKVG